MAWSAPLRPPPPPPPADEPLGLVDCASCLFVELEEPVEPTVELSSFGLCLKVQTTENVPFDFLPKVILEPGPQSPSWLETL